MLIINGLSLQVLGNNAFVTVIIPLLIALSAFGNVLAVTFANSRGREISCLIPYFVFETDTPMCDQ